MSDDLSPAWEPTVSPVDWEEWWREKISSDEIHGYLYPILEAPLVHYRGKLHDLANRDHLLVEVMETYGLKTILCAGNGFSQEPGALAAAGFQVTALDLSPTATNIAKLITESDGGFGFGIRTERPGGKVDFVIGDLLNETVAPGPFDVIIERRTVSRFPVRKRPAALEALAARLSGKGILLSHSNNLNWLPAEGQTRLAHTSESWFREKSWTIWDGAPSLPFAGRVAWLIESM